MQQQKQKSSWNWALTGLVVALVGGGVAGLYFWNKKKREEQADSETTIEGQQAREFHKILYSYIAPFGLILWPAMVETQLLLDLAATITNWTNVKTKYREIYDKYLEEDLAKVLFDNEYTRFNEIISGSQTRREFIRRATAIKDTFLYIGAPESSNTRPITKGTVITGTKGTTTVNGKQYVLVGYLDGLSLVIGYVPYNDVKIETVY